MTKKDNNKNKKEKRKTYTTPKGFLLFCHIVIPDYGTEKYPDEKGSFKLTIALDAADADKLKEMLKDEIAKAEAYTEEKFSELKPQNRNKLKECTHSTLGVEEYDKEDNPTGRILFKFHTSAFVDRNEVKRQKVIPVFDSMMQPVHLEGNEPGNNSIVRVSFAAAPYFVASSGTGGLTLYLNAMQIIKLETFNARTAADYGFSAEEGGFTGTEEDAVESDSSEEATPETPKHVPQF